jgi:hypothetical protein
VRIASPNIAVAAADAPTDAQDAFDLVSTSQLFLLAATRFDAALATSTIGGPRTAPSAIVAVMALQQAQAGLNNLQSINVPMTPFDVRTRAARAMDHARQGIALLREYHADVAGLGDGAHAREMLPLETIQLLDGGRMELRTAIAIARNP